MAAVSAPRSNGPYAVSSVARERTGMQESGQRPASPGAPLRSYLDQSSALAVENRPEVVQTNGDAGRSAQLSSKFSHRREQSAGFKTSKALTTRDYNNYVVAAAPGPREVGREGNALPPSSDNTSVEWYRGGYDGSRNGRPVGDQGLVMGVDYNLDDEDPDNSKWVHRDKLARIEIEEMQRAGIYLPGPVRPGSRPLDRRDRSLEHGGVDSMTDDIGANPERKRILPPTTQAEQASYEVVSGTAQEPQDEHFDYELRRPEEAAADQPVDRSNSRRPVRKASWSKIPLSKTSPIPVPQDYIEKHTPTQRSRNGGWVSVDEDGFAYRKTRSRSQSVGSQMLLDDHDGEGGGRSTPTPGQRVSSQGSPPKGDPKGRSSTTTGRPPSSSHGPRSSLNRGEGSFGNNNNKTRGKPSGAKDSPGARPGTRSGEIKRPEGDPPWLATMYKPDPRLPPEQQLIPTVAKRLQLEQMEKEGKRVSGSHLQVGRYDVDSVTETHAGPSSMMINNNTQQQSQPPQQEAEWPLKSPTPVPSTGGRSNTSGGVNGGGGGMMVGRMEGMEKRQQPSPDGRQRMPGAGAGVVGGNHTPREMSRAPAIPPHQPHQPPPPTETIRVQDPGEEKESKGGCRCCIVM
ncbi:MAG: hypothetical protein M1823_000619 [Watsoniomyces obsoletus]|nr:MAG: hypothetical protein M1823_000619 [Watsoniomyces obsoletus]